MINGTVHLVLVLELDGGTPDEVRAYGESVVARITHDRFHDRQKTMVLEWRAEQLHTARLEVGGYPVVGGGDALEGGAPSTAACSHGYHRGVDGRHRETLGACSDVDENRTDRPQNRAESAENRGESIDGPR